jgi:rare lipoprotein A
VRSNSTSTRRVWLAVNVLVTLLLLPALFTEPEAEPVVVATSSGSFQTVPVAATFDSTTTSTTAAPTTTTTAAPKPTPKAAAAPAPKPKPTTTSTTAAPKPKPRPTTTTTAAPAAAPAASGTESGKASWYDHQPGICAHKTLPMGTVVTVSAKGRSTTCTVGDRGPFVEGWIIDLHPQQFEQLAPRSAGVIAVTISW